jgi:hypothetical protein
MKLINTFRFMPTNYTEFTNTFCFTQKKKSYEVHKYIPLHVQNYTKFINKFRFMHKMIRSS